MRLCSALLIYGLFLDPARARAATFPILIESAFQTEAGLEQVVRAEAGAALAYFNLYPDHDLYFMARDALRLAQVARIVARVTGRPELAERIHVLHISSESISSPHLPDYLRDEGVSPEALRGGRKIVLIDTGFQGSIPEAILKTVPDDLKAQIKIQMLSSPDLRHPELTSFGLDAPPIRLILGSGEVHDLKLAVGLYAGLPKETGKALDYERVDEKWRAVFNRPDGSIVTDPRDKIDPEAARALLRKAEIQLALPESLAWMRERNQAWTQAIAAAQAPRLPRTSRTPRLSELEEAMIRDARFSIAQIRPRPPGPAGLSLPRLSISSQCPGGYADLGKKAP